MKKFLLLLILSFTFTGCAITEISKEEAKNELTNAYNQVLGTNRLEIEYIIEQTTDGDYLKISGKILFDLDNLKFRMDIKQETEEVENESILYIGKCIDDKFYLLAKSNGVGNKMEISEDSLDSMLLEFKNQALEELNLNDLFETEIKNAISIDNLVKINAELKEEKITAETSFSIRSGFLRSIIAEATLKKENENNITYDTTKMILRFFDNPKAIKDLNPKDF